ELDLDAVDLPQEVVVPPAAPVLAVRYARKADRFLARDCPGDAAVFDPAKRLRADLAALEIRARFLDLERAQQASDLVCAKRRSGIHGWTASVPQLTMNPSERSRKLLSTASVRSGWSTSIACAASQM